MTDDINVIDSDIVTLSARLYILLGTIGLEVQTNTLSGGGGGEIQFRESIFVVQGLII